jgi:Transposase DDE domain
MIPPAQGSGRRLRRCLAPLVAQAGATAGADRYRKHFPATAHLWILLAHLLSGRDSLRQTHAELAADPDAWGRFGVPGGVSRSQLARSSTSRPAACAEALFAAVVTAARRHHAADSVWRTLAKHQVVDSTFLRLAGKLAPWSRHGQHTPGVRIQTGFDLAGAIPSELRLTLTDTADSAALLERDLTGLAGWTLVFDLGYYAHRSFARLRDHAVSFLCRLHPQAVYHVTADHAVDATPSSVGDVVQSDQTITLGSPNNRRGAVLPGVRLVVSRNAKGEAQRFVTDRFDLTAAEVAALYRQRWQIELFFRWLKYQLKRLQPLGASREAVWLGIVIAATVAVLTSLILADRPRGCSRIEWLRGVAVAFHAAAPTPRRIQRVLPDTS